MTSVYRDDSQVQVIHIISLYTIKLDFQFKHAGYDTLNYKKVTHLDSIAGSNLIKPKSFISLLYLIIRKSLAFSIHIFTSSCPIFIQKTKKKKITSRKSSSACKPIPKMVDLSKLIMQKDIKFIVIQLQKSYSSLLILYFLFTKTQKRSKIYRSRH